MSLRPSPKKSSGSTSHEQETAPRVGCLHYAAAAERPSHTAASVRLSAAPWPRQTERWRVVSRTLQGRFSLVVAFAGRRLSAAPTRRVSYGKQHTSSQDVDVIYVQHVCSHCELFVGTPEHEQASQLLWASGLRVAGSDPKTSSPHTKKQWPPHRLIKTLAPSPPEE